MVVFGLTRPAVLRVTVVRVYPSCEVLASFVVRGREGLNRIRFDGRLRGRPLPSGAYRLVVRARGASRDAAAVRLVISRRPMRPGAVQKALSTSVCSGPVADLGRDDDAGATPGGSNHESGGGGVLSSLRNHVAAVLRPATGTVKGAAESLANATDDPVRDPWLLTFVGVFTLMSAILGGAFLVRFVRENGFRRRYY